MDLLMTVGEAASCGDSTWLRKALDGAFGEIPAADLEWALLRACVHGHLDCARLLLKHGVPLDCRDKFNRCPLTNAAKHGHVGIVALLLDGAFGEIPEADLEKVLLRACDFGCVELFKLVLKHGVRLYYRDNYNRCPLSLAAEHGHVCIVELLLDGAFDEIPVANLESALLRACKYGHLDCVRLLLKHGVRLDYRYNYNSCPLNQAAEHGHVCIVELLLDGAFDEIPAANLESALLRACKYGHMDCVRLLLKHGVRLEYRDRCPLNLAADHGHVGIVELLLDGAFGEIPASNLESAIRRAWKYGHLDCVRLLLKHGVPLDCWADFDNSPLALAAKEGNVDIIDLLLDGAFDEIPVANLESALLRACEYGHLDCVRLLLKHGVPLDCRDNYKRCPLYHAVQGHTVLQQQSGYGRQVGIVELLLEAGADVNSMDRYRCTVLHTAMYSGRTQIVNILLEAGANIDRLDGGGTSPLSIAISRHNHPVIKALIRGNCRLDIRCKVKYTWKVMSMFYLAMWEKDVETMEMLYQAGACTNAVLSECIKSDKLMEICSDAPAVYERLQHYMSQVNSLANMCRLSIRSCMRPPIIHTVMSLSLPMSLKAYILFND